MNYITIRRKGQRYYIFGDTHAIMKLEARFHWDGQRNAWWTGKLDDAQMLAGVETWNGKKTVVTKGEDLT